mgnify:CR=1 FL=1
MTLKEFYAAVGGDYDATLNRIPKESMVLRFVKKYADDKTYAQLTEAVGKQDWETAFRASHTLKGVAQNLGFDGLYRAAFALTEEMRQSERARDAREPAGLTREEAEKLFGALREDMRHMEEAPVESVEMREDLQAYFSALSDEIRKLSAQMGTQAAQSDDAGMMHLYEQARCEFKDFSEAIARTQKRLKQANESMEEAARYSRRLQKRARRTEEQGE